MCARGGTWKVTAVGENFVQKEIVVNPGEILSLQRHKYRTEEWTVESGQGIITLGEKKQPVKVGDVFVIHIETWHRIENNGTKPLVLRETQTGDILDESDIERIEDNYGRADKNRKNN